MREKNIHNGFTLIEMLIVVIIIGIFMAISMPLLLKTIEAGKVGEAKSNLILIRTSQKDYYLDNGVFTSNLSQLNIENPNNITANYFNYSINSANSTDFLATAARKSNAPGPYNTYFFNISKNGTISTNSPFR